MSPIGIVVVHQTRNGGNIIDNECLVEGIHGILDSEFWILDSDRKVLQYKSRMQPAREGGCRPLND
ncbi:MAG: hypothetical protein M1130_11385 [Actinobacteria bacterium]|nr:hypothetical protein [Actinomycetota bacterium]